MAKTAVKKKTTPKVKLLSGGNPQIPMGDGEKPIKAYIDAIISKSVPDVRKAVKWNSAL